jgi:hypothetical protein
MYWFQLGKSSSNLLEVLHGGRPKVQYVHDYRSELADYRTLLDGSLWGLCMFSAFGNSL